jgi:hypothetical protein
MRAAKSDLQIRSSKGEPTEQYYKWQFIYALIHSGLYAKDFIGVEVGFPKGNNWRRVSPFRRTSMAIVMSSSHAVATHPMGRNRPTVISP